MRFSVVLQTRLAVSALGLMLVAVTPLGAQEPQEGAEKLAHRRVRDRQRGSGIGAGLRSLVPGQGQGAPRGPAVGRARGADRRERPGTQQPGRQPGRSRLHPGHSLPHHRHPSGRRDPRGGGMPRDFKVTGTNYSAQGGAPRAAGCRSVPPPRRSINLVAVDATGRGQPPPHAFWQQHASGEHHQLHGQASTSPTGLAVAICDPSAATCSNDITIQANVSATHLVADVQGYFQRVATGGVRTALLADGAVTAPKIGSGVVVRSLNSLTDAVTLAAGSNVSITPSGNTLTVSATPGGGGGDITAVNTPLTGGLQGGVTSGDANLGLVTCGATQLLKSNGTTWGCASDGDSGVNAVIGGQGITGSIAARTLTLGSTATAANTAGAIVASRRLGELLGGDGGARGQLDSAEHDLRLGGDDQARRYTRSCTTSVAGTPSWGRRPGTSPSPATTTPPSASARSPPTRRPTSTPPLAPTRSTQTRRAGTTLPSAKERSPRTRSGAENSAFGFGALEHNNSYYNSAFGHASARHEHDRRLQLRLWPLCARLRTRRARATPPSASAHSQANTTGQRQLRLRLPDAESAVQRRFQHRGRLPGAVSAVQWQYQHRDRYECRGQPHERQLQHLHRRHPREAANRARSVSARVSRPRTPTLPESMHAPPPAAPPSTSAPTESSARRPRPAATRSRSRTWTPRATCS